jgi:oxygen-independent coproporphyrinogen-3 oxidase
MNVQGKNKAEQNSLGLYVHVPFCSSTCDFCAFYQEKPRKNSIKSYIIWLRREFMRIVPPRSVETIFIGGGTPGVLSPDQLSELCEIVGGKSVDEVKEWSVELAPNEVTPEKLGALKAGGVTRVSLGVQTFDTELLGEMGRRHPPEKVLSAYDLIRDMGFESVNLDLIFGAPGQTIEQWEGDLSRAVELCPEHISTYCLTFEEDTALYARLAKGELSIDPEREAAFYELAWEYLPSRGYDQYEVSNFARTGMESLHNLNTWRMNEWLGYGPSAASQFGGKRYRNVSNLEAWGHSLEENNASPIEDVEALSDRSLAYDSVLFGLRLNAGFDFAEIGHRFSVPSSAFDPLRLFFQRFEDEGLAERAGERYRLLDAGRILADAIASELPELATVV